MTKVIIFPKDSSFPPSEFGVAYVIGTLGKRLAVEEIREKAIGRPYAKRPEDVDSPKLVDPDGVWESFEVEVPEGEDEHDEVVKQGFERVTKLNESAPEAAERTKKDVKEIFLKHLLDLSGGES